eukprot:664502-Pelagomonas_calceolata.AAC.4
MQERQVRFVVSSLRYLQHQYRLGIYSDGSSGEASESKKRFSCRYEEIRYGGSVPSRCADTHPGLVLLGHSFGGVIARAAMVAAAQQGDVGEYQAVVKAHVYVVGEYQAVVKKHMLFTVWVYNNQWYKDACWILAAPDSSGCEIQLERVHVASGVYGYKSCEFDITPSMDATKKRVLHLRTCGTLASDQRGAPQLKSGCHTHAHHTHTHKHTHARTRSHPYHAGPHTVSLLLTTSSPHQRPPIPSHPSLQRFYHRHAAAAAAAGERATLNSPSPAAGQEGAPSLQHTGRTDGLGHFMPPVVSINSDYNDTQVGTLLTSLSGLRKKTAYKEDKGTQRCKAR